MRAKALPPASPNTSRNTLASARLPTVNQNRCGVSVSSSGPGRSPSHEQRADDDGRYRIAGMPSVSIGT